MPASQLERAFARRMVPLCAFVGLVVATVPPVTFAVLGRAQLRTQARLYAQHIGARVARAAQRQPYLWRYNAAKLYQAAMLHRRQEDIAAIKVTDCRGRTVFRSEAPSGTLSIIAPRPAAWAPVRIGAKLVSWVEVRMDVRQHSKTLIGIAIVATMIGLGVGVLLYVLPTGVVRRQAATLRQTLLSLQNAEQRLTDANRGLAERVYAAVTEVRALSGRVVSIQEEERRRIARDLHDGIGQSIAALQTELELLAVRPDEAQKRLERGIRECAHAVTELRRVVRELRPLELMTDDLCSALRSYAERFEERTGIQTSFRTTADIVCSEQVATCLLRILQEALTNVGRHARAQEVGIALTLSEEGTLSMQVEDDGCGFDASAPCQGTGLRSMRERCQFLGGHFDVTARPGEGTQISAHVPPSASATETRTEHQHG